MRTAERKAVSPIIATLLLIAIAVAAGIIVYVFTNSIAGNLTQGGGQQVSDLVSMDAYTFPNAGATQCTGSISNPCVQMVVRTTGSPSVTFLSLYYDGNLCQASGSICTVYPTSTAGTCTNNGLWTSSGGPTCTSGQYVILTVGSAIAAGSSASGTSHLIRIETQDGGSFTFSVTSGRSG
jgi:flagellin-like protein